MKDTIEFKKGVKIPEMIQREVIENALENIIPDRQTAEFVNNIGPEYGEPPFMRFHRLNVLLDGLIHGESTQKK